MSDDDSVLSSIVATVSRRRRREDYYGSQVRLLTGHHCVVAFDKPLRLHLQSASLIKQYNLLPTKGMVSLADKVIPVIQRGRRRSQDAG